MRTIVITDEELSMLIAEYDAGATMLELSKKYSCSPTTIHQAFKRAGHKARPRNIPGQRYTLSMTKEQIKEAYERGSSTYDIAKMCDAAPNTILAHLVNMGVVRRDNSHARRKYVINENYFEKIDTQEKAYWLGYLFADGYNNTSKNNIQLQTAVYDQETVEKFKKALGSNSPIKSYFGVKGHEHRRIEIHNKKLSEDLNRLGCVRAKTFILKFPSEEVIQKEFLASFMLGYFDGDGSMWRSLTSAQMEVAGNEEFITEYRRQLMLHCALNETKIKLTKNTYVCRYGGRLQLKKIYDFLYASSPVFLERKKKAFQDAINSTPTSTSDQEVTTLPEQS